MGVVLKVAKKTVWNRNIREPLPKKNGHCSKILWISLQFRRDFVWPQSINDGLVVFLSCGTIKKLVEM